jgi:hypothetical protein
METGSDIADIICGMICVDVSGVPSDLLAVDSALRSRVAMAGWMLIGLVCD